ncbi:hypothetical protein [Legionella cincinnatiensis]|uniref:Uncharacterized protein n=1 Tax=Legionella cincinnatiensis TaxID=28085 RepID=A0A378IGC0_9GAMM|nr:hypothetical protein [Legionella cincinnatiensis]KTC87239.1 hypothetical protein Lcin_1598 [Legionella cincinnatiensis]STX34298.1 Uncharacterised protein [Legionella cincinnatiensis]
MSEEKSEFEGMPDDETQLDYEYEMNQLDYEMKLKQSNAEETNPSVKESPSSKGASLFLTLPLSIIKNYIFPQDDLSSKTFNCPLRKKLHEKCMDSSEFHKNTIIPVNVYLDEKAVPLHQEAYDAIAEDMDTPPLWKSDVSTTSKLSLYWQKKIDNQMSIAQAFERCGESEGAKLHTIMASLYEKNKSFTNSLYTKYNPADYYPDSKEEFGNF